jgi:hypothetical protein
MTPTGILEKSGSNGAGPLGRMTLSRVGHRGFT